MAFIDLFSEDADSEEELPEEFAEDEDETAFDFASSKSVSLSLGIDGETIELARQCGLDDAVIRGLLENNDVLAQLFGPKEQRLAEHFEAVQSAIYYLVASIARTPDMVIASIIRNNPDCIPLIKERLENLMLWIQSQQ